SRRATCRSAHGVDHADGEPGPCNDPVACHAPSLPRKTACREARVTALEVEWVGLTPTDEQPLTEFQRDTNLRSVVVGASKDPNAKLIVLLVDPSTCRPVLAVKVPTTDAAEAAVEAERAVLEQLRA